MYTIRRYAHCKTAILTILETSTRNQKKEKTKDEKQQTILTISSEIKQARAGRKRPTPRKRMERKVNGMRRETAAEEERQDLATESPQQRRVEQLTRGRRLGPCRYHGTEVPDEKAPGSVGKEAARRNTLTNQGDRGSMLLLALRYAASSLIGEAPPQPASNIMTAQSRTCRGKGAAGDGGIALVAMVTVAADQAHQAADDEVGRAMDDGTAVVAVPVVDRTAVENTVESTVKEEGMVSMVESTVREESMVSMVKSTAMEEDMAIMMENTVREEDMVITVMNQAMGIRSVHFLDYYSLFTPRRHGQVKTVLSVSEMSTQLQTRQN